MERKQKKPTVLPLSSSSSSSTRSLSLSLSLSPLCLPRPPSFPSSHFFSPSLPLHALLPHSISFPQFIILSHFPRLSVSPPFTSSSSSSSLPQPSPLPFYPFRSFQSTLLQSDLSLCLWRRIELGCQGFQPSRRAKPPLHRLNQLPFEPQPKSEYLVCVCVCVCACVCACVCVWEECNFVSVALRDCL